MRMLSLSVLLMLALCLQGCGGGNTPDDAPPASDENVEAPGDSMEDSSLGEPGEMPSPDEAAPEAGSANSSGANGEAVAASDSTLNYIPEDAVAAVIVRPFKALNNPTVKKIITLINESSPQESIEDRMTEFADEVGVKPDQVDHVLVVVDKQLLAMAPMMLMGGPGMRGPAVEFDEIEAEVLDLPEADRAEEVKEDKDEILFQPGGFGGPGAMSSPPSPTIIVQLASGVSSQSILDSVPEGKEIDIAGGKGVVTPDGGVLFKVSDSRLVYASQQKMEAALKNASSGKVRSMLEPSAASDVALAVDLDPIKGFLQQAMQNNPNPAMALVMPIISQLQTLTISADLQADTLVQIQVSTPNADAAKGVQGMLTGYLNMGKQQYEQAKGEVPPEMQSFAKQLVDGAALSTKDSVVSLTIPRPDNFEQLPEMMKPAIAKAATAAQEAVKKNSLKQVGLAFHNYHDVYRHFPAVDSNGEKDEKAIRGKGLSWRVHLLPFLDQAALFEEFNLDEAWDSEHNKALISKMPSLFGDNKEGKTSMHVFVGEKLAFNEGKPGVGIRDYLDGTSNTILVVKAGDDTADIWTKPGGLKFNAEDPMAALGNIGDSFLALLCDGSVQTLSKEIDKVNMANLIQQNDGNPVDY